MTHTSISTEDLSYRKYAFVLDTWMAYVDVGYGDPIVLLHGNPTPSYLWRSIIPYSLPFGRCLAQIMSGWAIQARLQMEGTASYTIRNTSMHGIPELR